MASPASEQSVHRLHGVVRVTVMLALMLSLMLEALDQTVVGTAMPRIIGQLHGLDRYSWAVTAYLLASTTLIPIAGKLSDQFGRKWFLIVGIVIFLLGSALCGTSQTIDQLIAFRTIQGLGAGIGISLVFTLVGDIFPPAERARWQGVLGSVYGVSSVIGPTLGGWLADHGPLLGTLVTDSSRWRWVFYINLPLGVVSLTVLVVYLPTNISVRSSYHTGWAAVRRIDFIGATLATTATVLLLVGLTLGGGTSNWSSPQVIGALGGASLLFVAFVVAERAAVEPILPLDLFRHRVFAADSLLSFFLYMVLFGMAFYVPLFLQGVLALSPTKAGATMTPFSVTIVVGNSLAGLAITMLRRHQAVTILGSVIMASGVFLLARMTPATSPLQVSAFAVIAGIGMGTLFTATAVVAQNALPPTHLGVGLGAVRYLGQIGGALGVAMVGTVVNFSLSGDLAKRLPAAALKRLASEGVTLSGDPHILFSPTYRAAVLHSAVRNAAARVPAGPQHGRNVALVRGQVQQVLDQVFGALRLSLAVAIQHGLMVALLFCGAAILAACFVQDVPAAQQPSDPTEG